MEESKDEIKFLKNHNFYNRNVELKSTTLRPKGWPLITRQKSIFLTNSSYIISKNQLGINFRPL